MVTTDELQRAVGGYAVEEEVNSQYRLVYLYVRPTRAGLDPIYVCLQEDRSFVQQFGFGQWHYHPDEIAEAVETAGRMVRGELCLVEERDAQDRYLGSGLYPPDGLPDSLLMATTTLRRVFFDREPAREAIDFGRYYRGQHLWIAHDRKAEAERVYREVGMRIPDW
jgi:hypothetical protein